MCTDIINWETALEMQLSCKPASRFLPETLKIFKTDLEVTNWDSLVLRRDRQGTGGPASELFWVCENSFFRQRSSVWDSGFPGPPQTANIATTTTPWHPGDFFAEIFTFSLVLIMSLGQDIDHFVAGIQRHHYKCPA